MSESWLWFQRGKQHHPCNNSCAATKTKLPRGKIPLPWPWYDKHPKMAWHFQKGHQTQSYKPDDREGAALYGGLTQESKFPASDFSCIKLLGKQRFSFSFQIQPQKNPDCDKPWCFRTRAIFKWKIVASIFSGALLK